MCKDVQNTPPSTHTHTQLVLRGHVCLSLNIVSLWGGSPEIHFQLHLVHHFGDEAKLCELGPGWDARPAPPPRIYTKRGEL